jgi:hypothetical protein
MKTSLLFSIIMIDQVKTSDFFLYIFVLCMMASCSTSNMQQQLLACPLPTIPREVIFLFNACLEGRVEVLGPPLPVLFMLLPVLFSIIIDQVTITVFHFALNTPHAVHSPSDNQPVLVALVLPTCFNLARPLPTMLRY